MALNKTRDAKLWLSLLPQVAPGTDYLLGAEYGMVRSTTPNVIVANFEFETDAGIPGAGHEFATERCLVYTLPSAIAIADKINDAMLGRLMLRSVGGTVVDTTLTVPAYSHKASMLAIASGLQLPLTSAVAELAAASWRLGDFAVERFRLFQEGAAVPRVECDLINTGKTVTPHAVVSLPSTPLVLNCLDGNGSIVQWTDAGGLRDFTLGEGLRRWSCEVVNNNVIPDRNPGDPVNTFTYETVTVTPPYQRRLLRGDRAVNASIVIPLQGTKVEWEKYVIGQPITDFTFAGRGGIITGAHRRKLQYVIPKCKISNIQHVDDRGDACLQISVEAMWDTVSGGALTAEVINDVATNYR